MSTSVNRDDEVRTYRALRAAVIVSSLLSILVPIAVALIVAPRNFEEFTYVGGMWSGETWWHYAYTGIATSAALGVMGIVLTARWLKNWLAFAIVAFVVSLLADTYLWLRFAWLGISL
jgi:hypothetical protein